MKTLFFDLARTTGFAAGDLRGVEEFGTFTLPQTYDEVAPYLRAAFGHMRAIIKRTKPQKIGFEAPILNTKRDGVMKLRKLYGLANNVELLAHEAGIPCVEASLGEIRSHFLGAKYPRDSERVKIAVKNKCRSNGWKIKDDNEADALAGLDYLLSLERPERAVAIQPLFQSRARRSRAQKLQSDFESAGSTPRAAGRR